MVDVPFNFYLYFTDERSQIDLKVNYFKQIGHCDTDIGKEFYFECAILSGSKQWEYDCYLSKCSK